MLFSIATINGLFLGAYLIDKLGWIMELDLEVFQINSFVNHAASTYLEKKKNINFSRKI